MQPRSLLIACILAAAACAARAQQATCPIDPSRQDLDFSPVASACSDVSKVCSTCVCALVDVYKPALVAGGVTFNPNDPSSFPLDKTAGIIRACSEQYIVSMLMANINVTALSALSSCTFTANNVPSCLAPAVESIATAANSTVKATSREQDASQIGTADNASSAQLPAGTSSLRVATVQKQGDAVSLTLAGQLSSASQLLKSMAASQELVGALAPATAQQLQALAANPSVDANPSTSAVLAGLSNPIDANALIDSLSKLAASAPAPAAAVGGAAPAAPAPPKKNGAGVAAPLGVATGLAAVLLAALLL